jgi:SPP1 family predicted phage head-tail adaptor
MYFSERITLIDIRERSGDRGDIVELKRERDVWADKKSATRAEFYQAQTAGMKAETTFTIWQSDYHGEERVIHNGTIYDVIRTYETGKDKIEIVCKRGIR